MIILILSLHDRVFSISVLSLLMATTGRLMSLILKGIANI